MKIILFGKNGQIGRAVDSLVGGQYHDFKAYARKDVDFEHPDELQKIIEVERPDIIINAAAYTNVDRAESQPEKAMQINAEAVRVIAESAKSIDAWVIHYSTDYVYDGQKDGAYIEGDEESPINTYGTSKLAGDRAIIKSGCKHIILRTSWIYGGVANNFPTTILRLAQERSELSVVGDQFGAPTDAKLLAEVTRDLIGKIGTGQVEGGVYHLSSKGRASWCDVAKLILREAAQGGVSLSVTEGQVKRISSEEYGAAAKRPKNSCLNTSKIEQVLGYNLPEWDVGIREWVGHYIQMGDR